MKLKYENFLSICLILLFQLVISTSINISSAISEDLPNMGGDHGPHAGKLFLPINKEYLVEVLRNKSDSLEIFLLKPNHETIVNDKIVVDIIENLSKVTKCKLNKELEHYSCPILKETTEASLNIVSGPKTSKVNIKF
jgi:hypothetical protein